MQLCIYANLQFGKFLFFKEKQMQGWVVRWQVSELNTKNQIKNAGRFKHSQWILYGSYKKRKIRLFVTWVKN